MKTAALVLLVFFLLGACASNPAVLDINNANADISPHEVSMDLASVEDELLVWGGVIIGAHNLEDVTQLEILSYPLKKSLRPDTTRTSTGRFFIRHSGYLEVLDYAPGRSLTVVGSVDRVQSQLLGEVSIDFPVLTDQQLHLWKEQSESSEPRINFGFGVILSN